MSTPTPDPAKDLPLSAEQPASFDPVATPLPSADLSYKSPEPPHDPYAALRLPNYRRYLAGQAIALLGGQMLAVAVGYELWRRTESTTALGLVGLVQIVPIFALFLPAGHIVDRANRRNIVLLCQLLQALVTLAAGLASLFRASIPPGALLDGANARLLGLAHAFGESKCHFDDRHVPILFAMLLANGLIRAFNQPAKSSLLPQLVPPQSFSNAVTWNSSTFELCSVTGPFLAGGAISLWEYFSPGSAWTYASIYFFTACTALTQLVFFLGIRLEVAPRPREPMTLQSLLAGIRFVFSNRIILGAITLDMFAVLLGGATALLPVYATDILHAGPVGFAALRAAPSIGAITTAMLIAHMPPFRRAGRALLLAVAGFGVATIVFGLSGWLLLSLAALFLTGVFDNVSVVVRHSLVQILTPDHMRGRVSAVNAVFISSSNELGAFESGAAAALGERFFGATGGPIFSVVSGGVGTILVVAAVAVVFPQVKRIGSLADLSPETAGTR